MDLTPESIRYLNNYFNSFVVVSLCFIFLVLGIILSMILDNHVDNVSNNNSLFIFKVGILSMIVIILHNIPEDFICHVSH